MAFIKNKFTQLTSGNQNISGVKTFADSIQVAGTGIFNNIDLSNLDNLTLSGIDLNIYDLGSIDMVGADLNIKSGNIYTDNLVIRGNLLQSSQPSGYLTGVGYSGNYDGGYFLGRTKLSQNTLILKDESFGKNNTTKESIRNWQSVAISADGKYQSAVANTADYIYISSDYGDTWQQKASSLNWFKIAMSADGKYQTASTYNTPFGYLYTSDNYGNTWTQIPTNETSIQDIAMSSDGKIQIFVRYTTSEYKISRDYGKTWTNGTVNSTSGVKGVAISSDGKYITIVGAGGSDRIYTSSNYGLNWTTIGSIGTWNSVTMSADGKFQAAVTGGAGYVYISNDYGNTWTRKNNAGSRPWLSISMSSDGKYIAATTNGNYNYVSSDYGENWTVSYINNRQAGSFYVCNDIAVSSNGKYTLTAAQAQYIYVSKTEEKLDGNLYTDNVYGNNLVYTSDNQTISGIKTFANGANQILNTTYSTLTGLKAASGLLSGQLYRISDFVLKWNNQSYNDQTVKTAASGEPLIVTALSNKQIYHIAQSEIYPQDTIYYNIDANSSYSWGTINNNASIPDFKGWIYRRVDNLLNIDIPYDWRNIRVNCCRPNVSSVPNYSGNYSYNRFDYVKETGNNSNRGKLYYSVTTGNSGNALNNTDFWSQVSSFVESGTYFSTDEDPDYNVFRALYLYDPISEEYVYKINLPPDTNSRIQQPTFTSTLTASGTFTLNDVYNIRINGGHSNFIQGSSVYNNTIGNGFSNNTITSLVRNNTIGDYFAGNIVGYFFDSNNIAMNCAYNIIGSDFVGNTISNFFINNSIGSYFRYNTIEISAGNNIIGNLAQSNYIGKFFSVNSIGDFFQYNNIGSSFQYNNIRNSFQRNTSESTVNSIDFSTSTHVYSGYNKTLFSNSAGTLRLRYFNSSDQLVVTDPTA